MGPISLVNEFLGSPLHKSKIIRQVYPITHPSLKFQTRICFFGLKLNPQTSLMFSSHIFNSSFPIHLTTINTSPQYQFPRLIADKKKVLFSRPNRILRKNICHQWSFNFCLHLPILLLQHYSLAIFPRQRTHKSVQLREKNNSVQLQWKFSVNKSD